MSRRGNCHDNAVAESFFQLLKRERIKQQIYVSRGAAKSEVFNYIEMFYNTQRLHGYNNGLSPVEFEKRFSKRDCWVSTEDGAIQMDKRLGSLARQERQSLERDAQWCQRFGSREWLGPISDSVRS